MTIFLSTKSELLQLHQNCGADLDKIYETFFEVRKAQSQSSDHTLAALIIDKKLYAAFEAWECEKGFEQTETRYTHHSHKNPEINLRFAKIWKLPELKGVK